MITEAGPARTSERFWTASNMLSITRALLSIPFAMIMLSSAPGARWWAVGIIVLAIVTDRLDGALARKYHQETEWGKILDPLADKIGVAVAGLVLLVVGLIPVWFVAALVARDLLILAGGLVIRARTGRVLPSHISGKITIGTVGVTLAFPLLGVPDWLMVLGLVLSTAMLLVSLGFYLVRFVQELRT